MDNNTDIIDVLDNSQEPVYVVSDVSGNVVSVVEEEQSDSAIQVCNEVNREIECEYLDLTVMTPAIEPSQQDSFIASATARKNAADAKVQAQYAKEQGDYAKAQAILAAEAIANANKSQWVTLAQYKAMETAGTLDNDITYLIENVNEDDEYTGGSYLEVEKISNDEISTLCDDTQQ